MEWRCVVCGKRITEDNRPDACPLCGVAGDYIVPETEYDKPSGPLTAEALADLDRALALEEEATSIYEEAKARAAAEGDKMTALFFEAFARNEKGHQAAIKFQKKMRGA